MCLPELMRGVWQAEAFGCFLFVTRKWKWLYAGVSVLLVNILLTSCLGLNSGGGPMPQSTPTGVTTVVLAKLHWCGKPSMIFRDEGATGAINVAPTTRPAGTVTPVATPITNATATSGTTPTATTTPSAATATTINDWSQVEANLGFTIYLPMTLQYGACLNSASGTIHDPIFGGSFTIGYLLPDHSALTFSEAPVRTQNTAFQCSESKAIGSSANEIAKTGIPTAVPTGTATTTPGHAVSPLQVCTGSRDTTNIAFSARGTTTKLEQLFHELKPNIAWIPVS